MELDEELARFNFQGMTFEKWTLDGVITRPYFPALTIYQNGIGKSVCGEFWFKDGKLHRDGYGPAYQVTDPDYHHTEKRFYRNGLLHRENGHALEFATVDKSLRDDRYFIDGVEKSEEDFPVTGVFRCYRPPEPG